MVESGGTPSAQVPPPTMPGEKLRPPDGRRGWGIWAFLTVVVVAGTVLLLFAMAAILIGARSLFSLALTTGMAGGGAAPARLAQFGFREQHIAGDPRASAKILVVPISGVILDEPRSLAPLRLGLVSATRLMLEAAASDERVRGVVLEIDSPGGGITASDVLYNEVMRFRRESGKPIIALLDDLGASGAYYVAAAADHIIAHPTTLTGSIGVIMPWFGVRGLLDKIGVEVRPVKSGEMKDIAAVYRDPLPEERRLLSDIVAEYHRRFVSVVQEGLERRGVMMKREQLEALCDGRLWTGEQAKALGFVDDVGYFQDAVEVAARRVGVSPRDLNVVAYVAPRPLLSLLLGQAGTGQPKALRLKVGGGDVPDGSRFMYLWMAEPSVTVEAE